MSSSFVNYQVHSENFAAVVYVAEQLVETKIYVSQPKNDWISVYDEASEALEPERVHTIAHEVSSAISNTVVAFCVYKSDYLVYLLYDKGQLIDEYNSDPDSFYFGFEHSSAQIKERVKGNPEILLSYCLPDTDLKLVTNLFAQRDVFIEDMIYEFAPLLGVDEVRATSSFYDVEDGYVYDNDIDPEVEVREDQKFHLIKH